MISVLLKFGHGLGDCVQLSVVLKHLRKYRPSWFVDVRCGRGKHTALIGLCRRVYHDEESMPVGGYDNEYDLGWMENYNHYPDRPNSKITNALQEVFGLEWDWTLGRYECHLGDEALGWGAAYYRSIGAVEKNGRFNVVLFHYEGNTSPVKKNVAHWQAQAIIETVLASGRIPVLLDWDRRSALPDNKTIFCPGAGHKIGDHELWGKDFGSGDAETIAALQTLAEAYIGIDSGPDKIVSSTETPALIFWKGHHPIQFHDPAPNTTHLIPHDHRKMTPCGTDQRIADFFESRYKYRLYLDEQDMVTEARKWLGEILGCEPKMTTPTVQYVLPNGIGDVMWALFKIKSVANCEPIDIILSGNPGNEVDHRSVPFLKRFPFVRNVSVMDIPVLIDRDNPADAKGRYRYKPDGLNGAHHYLIPNKTLEAGKRLEEWLPEHKLDWLVIDEFDWSNTQRGIDLGNALNPFVAFYLGPERGNVDEGHNRGFQWEPKHWIELGGAIRDRGYNIVVVGAPYDRSFWERYVRPGVEQDSQNWITLIGDLEIGETLALLRKATAFVSYQCGLGILHHYFGGKTAMWWRADQDSCHSSRIVAFDENMRFAWNDPKYAENYIGLLYKKESVADVLAEMDRREWLP